MAGTGERWTLDKQARFLEALAVTCNVAKSCRAVGMRDSGVYKLRLKSPAFREAWQVALHEGYVRLELMMLERAIEGTDRAVWHAGKKVGSVRQHDPRAAFQLLAAHRGAKHMAATPAPEAPDAIRAALTARFEEMAARMTDGE